MIPVHVTESVLSGLFTLIGKEDKALLKKIGMSLAVVGVVMVGMGIANTAFVKPVHAGSYNSPQAQINRILDKQINNLAAGRR